MKIPVQWQKPLGDLFGILAIAGLILFPSSGFKNALVWGSLLYLVIQALRDRRALHGGGLGVAILLVLGAGLVSSWYSIDRSFSFRQWIKLIEWTAGFFVLVNLGRSPQRMDRAIRWYVIAMAGVAGVDILRLAGSVVAGTLQLRDGRWFDSLLGYPTIAAGMYAIALLFGLLQIAKTERWATRLLYLPGPLLIMVLLHMLQTRSILLGLAGGLAAFILLAPFSARRQAGILATAAAILLLFVSVPGDFRDRIFSGATSDRTALWRDAERIMQEGVEREPIRAWVGFGYGHKIFEQLHKTIPRRQRAASRVYDHTHNMVWELRIQGGYLGLAAFAGLLLTAAGRGIKGFPPRADRNHRLNAAGITAALIALLIYGQFSLFFAYAPALVFWSLLAVFMAATGGSSLTPPSAADRQCSSPESPPA